MSTRVRVSHEVDTAEATPPRLEVGEHDFFWTYTEEPHRTRRQAIIKAHPEVCLSSSLRSQFSDQMLGNETLRAGAAHEIRRPLRCLPPGSLCIPPSKYAFPVMAVLFDGVYCWCHGESEFVPGDS